MAKVTLNMSLQYNRLEPSNFWSQAIFETIFETKQNNEMSNLWRPNCGADQKLEKSNLFGMPKFPEIL